MICKLCNLLQVTVLLILLCHSYKKKGNVSFKNGQQIEAIKNFQTSSEHPRKIKRGEIMTIKDIDKQGDIAVYNKKWGTKTEEWIEKGDFDKIQLSPTKAPAKMSVSLNDVIPKSKFNCVYWHVTSKKWFGWFYHEDKTICTAMHDDEEEVAKFVNLKCKKLGKDVKNPSLETEFYIKYDLVKKKEENKNAKQVNSDCTLNENDPNFNNTTLKEQQVMLENSNHVVTQIFLANLEDSENSSNKRKRKKNENFQHKKQYREDQNNKNKDKKSPRQTNTRFKKLEESYFEILDSDEEKNCVENKS